MAKVEIIAKLKQKNDADFKIADAKDIEMEDGSDLQSTIDNIKKNGTNIDTEKYATKEELETKADKEHTHDYNDITNAPEIPSIEGLATEDYVDTAIAAKEKMFIKDFVNTYAGLVNVQTVTRIYDRKRNAYFLLFHHSGFIFYLLVVTSGHHRSFCYLFW